jgi:tetratricopeptide (TPR) repeat protein
MALTAEALAQSTIDLDRHESLAAARELYATAEYRGALEMLDRLIITNAAPRDRQSIDLYRTFCLVALGRTQDADDAIVSMIRRDPLYRPADTETPPRLRPLFRDKRQQMLPTLIQARYERAKRDFDQSDYEAAVEGFSEVLLALDDPDIAGPANRSPLSDLRVLAGGFKGLAVRAMTSQAVPRTEATPPLEATPTRTPLVQTIYDSNDADVAAPVTVKQDLPRFPVRLFVDKVGVLYIVIDERGSVESAILDEPLDRTYDRMLLAAAKTWTYQPATRGGVAVKYRKRIQVTLPRQTN